MTTLNGAKFLGLEDEMGSVCEGKLADLVLLDADPLADVQNLHGIYGVVKGGTYYSSADLRNLLGTGGGSTPNPVPAPASFWLLLSGLGATAAVGAVGRRRAGAAAR